ncbi:sensor histidine kinase [Streptomyces sp. NPDC127098]|uniref:sensor histidine kinase n=1 Tax=Streptomyces sp. NPDC127098 TaxID=3347137 RepID=UPI00365F159B
MVWGFGWLESARRGSQLTRVHQYTRASLYGFSAMEAGMVGFALARDGRESSTWGLLAAGAVGAAHVAGQMLLTGAGLRHYLGSGPRPDRLLACYTGLTLVAVAVPVGAVAADGLRLPTASTFIVYVLMYYAAPVSLVLPVRRALALQLLPVGVAAAGLTAVGSAAVASALLVVVTCTVGAGLGVLPRASAWTLRVMDRLDAARETEARLAVAEERLRFGRDLHDVLGRNLSVIALKAELAVALARRGEAGAEASVAQMTEVQRIARESQAEMREVVRGYRAADLHAELAGARGVLEAAGISCRIEDGAAAELPAAVQSALGWVVREGTTNVLRHADAARCVVRLRRPGPDRVVLDMENDGVRRISGGGGGSGLAGLRERLAKLDGSLTAGGEDDVFRLTAEIRLGSGV